MSAEAKDHTATQALHLLGLSTLAIAQPLFDVLGRNAEFFVAHASRPADIVLLAGAIYVGIPLALWLLERLVGLVSARARRALHLLFVGSLALLTITFVAARGDEASEPAALFIGVVAGGLAAFAYARFTVARRFASALGVLSPVSPLLFLLQSPTSEIVRPQEAERVEHDARAAEVPVVLIVFDELPLLSIIDSKGELDPVRAPQLTALARHATWFRNATTVSDGTTVAVPALLTGRLPKNRSLPTFENYSESLFTLLAPTHEIHAHEVATSLCPKDLCQPLQSARENRIESLFADVGVVAGHVLLPEALKADLPAIDNRWAGFGDAEDEPGFDEFFRRLAEGVGAGPRPTFHYLHVFLPHSPWRYLPSGQLYGPADATDHPRGIHNSKWVEDPQFSARALQRHLLQVGYADRLFGDLIRRLEERGVYDDALIAVVSDHGVSFAPGRNWRKLDGSNYVEMMSIPMLVKAPQQRVGRVSDRNVESIDLLPTLAELLETRVPWPVDGTSALDPDAPERSEKILVKFIGSERVRFDRVLPDRERALRERVARVGAGATADQLYRIGPHPELVGAAIEEADRAAPARIEIAIDAPGAYEAVDLEASVLPVNVTGRLITRGSSPPDLAVSLDGIVRATAAPYRVGDDWFFSALVPAAVLRAGFNRVEIFEIATDSLRPSLVPTRMPDAVSYSLERDPDGNEVLRRSDGSRLAIRDDGARGAIEEVRWAADLLTIAGYGYIEPDLKTPSGFVVLVNGEFVYAGSRNQGRPKVAQKFRRDKMAEVGFAFRIPVDASSFGAERKLRVFALYPDGAVTEVR